MNTVRRAGAEPIVCSECGTHFEGSRTDARRAFWEPWSTATVTQPCNVDQIDSPLPASASGMAVDAAPVASTVTPKDLPDTI